jgi:hypothetical protein
MILSLAVAGMLMTVTGSHSDKLTLKSKTILEQPSPLVEAFYVDRTGFGMMTYTARSTDNGVTWKPFEIKPPLKDGLHENYRRNPHPGFVDPVNGRLLTVMLALDLPEVPINAHEPPVGQAAYYLRYRVSTDQGKTFLFDEPIVQKGYTQANPFPDVRIGHNGIYLGDTGCRPIRTSKGLILVPAQAGVAGPDGKLINPGGGHTWTDVRVLIGNWLPDGHIEWDSAERVSGDPAKTTRGMIEPTLAELSDGRILMVMRGSNDVKPDLPGTKWYSISTDGGYHWSTPEPWRYSDGTSFFSPSSMSQILRHSNGRLYWLGNISPANPRGNRPRYPLVIGEIDPASGMLIKDSVITIDDIQPEDRGDVNLSNFFAFEDRETGDIVLPMRRHRPNVKEAAYQNVLYRVGVK